MARVATQGRNYNPSWPYGSHNQWVTKYKLQYRNDGVTFQYYKQQGEVKVNTKYFMYVALNYSVSSKKKMRQRFGLIINSLNVSTCLMLFGRVL